MRCLRYTKVNDRTGPFHSRQSLRRWTGRVDVYRDWGVRFLDDIPNMVDWLIQIRLICKSLVFVLVTHPDTWVTRVTLGMDPVLGGIMNRGYTGVRLFPLLILWNPETHSYSWVLVTGRQEFYKLIKRKEPCVNGLIYLPGLFSNDVYATSQEEGPVSRKESLVHNT